MTDEPIHKREDVEVENKATSLPEAEIARMTDDIVAALKTVYDPEIPADIYELGLIYKVDIEDDRSVKVEMTLTTPNCPSARNCRSWWRPRWRACRASAAPRWISCGSRRGIRAACPTRRDSF
jgi:Predicted metal-sulfur cluster biosynthetic enzyme